MRRKPLLLGAVALYVATVLAVVGLYREPLINRAYAQAADRFPPDVTAGAKIVFDLPKHPFAGEEFEGIPVVKEVRGHWVRMSQAIKRNFQDALKKREVTVWVNFNAVNWYGVVP